MKNFKTIRSPILLAFLFPVLFSLSGCTPSGIPVVQVKGNVVRNGHPVEEALVMFVPVSGGRSTAGKTDSQGNFVMITPGAKRAGCVPGTYKVLVTKKHFVDAKGNPVTLKVIPDKPGGKGTAPDYAMKSFLPDKFADPQTSGLEVQVAARTKNHFVFDLKE